MLWIDVAGVTVRSQSGDRNRGIVKGQGMAGSVSHIFNVPADDFTARDMTIGWVANHAVQIHGNLGASRTRLDNLRIVDTYEQMVKISCDASNSLRSQDGIMENCLLEYTAGIGPQYYIGGIDGHRTRDWTVRNCIFKNIISPSGSVAEHAVHFWSDAEGTVVEGNLHLRYAVPVAVDQGTVISGLTTDFDGDARPLGSGFDIGADEFSPKGNAAIYLLLD